MKYALILAVMAAVSSGSFANPLSRDQCLLVNEACRIDLTFQPGGFATAVDLGDCCPGTTCTGVGSMGTVSVPLLPPLPSLTVGFAITVSRRMTLAGVASNPIADLRLSCPLKRINGGVASGSERDTGDVIVPTVMYEDSCTFELSTELAWSTVIVNRRLNSLGCDGGRWLCDSFTGLCSPNSFSKHDSEGVCLSMVYYVQPISDVFASRKAPGALGSSLGFS